jgi:branched-chain amino acid transport system permease protein
VTTCLVLAALTAIVPLTVDLFSVLQVTSLAIMAILALSLALSYGFGGILCFGQAAFFGLGAYTYAVVTMNTGESTLAILLAILVPGLVALALGWFMFMGRLSALYVGVVTLCVTLILYNLINSTSDPWYRIGKVALNGFNGISAVPAINVPFMPDAWLTPVQTFVLSMVSLFILYLLCKFVAASAWGRVVAATRQNELRAELLGYNTALVKLGIFTLGSSVAGYAGCLFTAWNGFVSPNAFSLSMTAQIIIWVIVGGRSTFVGPMVGAVALQYLTTRLGNSGLDANMVLGAVLMIVVLVLPRGLVPTLGMVLTRWHESRHSPDHQLKLKVNVE